MASDMSLVGFVKEKMASISNESCECIRVRVWNFVYSSKNK